MESILFYGHCFYKIQCVYIYINWLVVWDMFPFIGNVITPTEVHSIVFQRGRSSTNSSGPRTAGMMAHMSLFDLFDAFWVCLKVGRSPCTKLGNT